MQRRLFAIWGNICLASFLIIFNAPAKPSLEDFACSKMPWFFASSKIVLWILGNHQKFNSNVFPTATQYLCDVHEQHTTSVCSQNKCHFACTSANFLLQWLWCRYLSLSCYKKVRTESKILKKGGCHAKKLLSYATYECPAANFNRDRYSSRVTAVSQVSKKTSLWAGNHNFPITYANSCKQIENESFSKINLISITSLPLYMLRCVLFNLSKLFLFQFFSN